MKQILFYSLILISFLACEREGFQAVDNEPVFEFVTEINGQNLNIQAGLEGVVNNPSFVDQNGLVNYVSSFSIPSNGFGSFRKINLHFKQFPKVTNSDESKTDVLNESLSYMLSFTGVEGYRLMPNIGGIVNPFVTAWTIDGKPISTQVSPLVPLPILREQGFVDVRYSLHIQNKFRGIMNSQISLDNEASCHGKLDIIKEQDKATLSFTPSNNMLTNIIWNNGSTDSNIEIDYEEQTLVMEANSSDCGMSMQLEITDPSSLPNALSYELDEVVGPATIMPYNGFVIEMIDDTGEIYRSDYNQQNSTSLIEIVSVKSFGEEMNGNPTLKVEGLIDATLYNLDRDTSIELKKGKVSFAFSHPAN